MKPGEITFRIFGNTLYGDCYIDGVQYSVGLRNARGTHEQKHKIQEAIKRMVEEERCCSVPR